MYQWFKIAKSNMFHVSWSNDQKLKWIDQIAHVKPKVAHGLGIINKAKPLKKIYLRNVYYSCIYPYFTYWETQQLLISHNICIHQNKMVKINTYSHKRHQWILAANTLKLVYTPV